MMPVGLISNSVLDVFKQKATSDFNRLGNCRDVYFSTFKHLILISGSIFIVFFIFAPDLFSFIFGQDWTQAGYYARYLSLFFILQFCISPLGFTLIISNRQDYNLYWQLILLIMTNIGLFIGYYFNNANYSIICFSILYSIMYLFYFKESYKASKGNLL